MEVSDLFPLFIYLFMITLSFLIKKFSKYNLLFIIIGFILCLILLFFTENAKKFFFEKRVEKVIEKLQFSRPLVVNDVISSKNYYNFEGDTIEPSYFFEEVSALAEELMKSDKQRYKIVAVVLNQFPTGALRVSEPSDSWYSEEKNQDFFNSLKSKDRNIREKSAIFRYSKLKSILENCQNSLFISISEGKECVNIDFFEKNKERFNGKIIDISASKLSTNQRGQIWLIKDLKTGMFILAGEKGGSQGHTLFDDKNREKQLYFYIFKSFYDIKKTDKVVYETLMQRGLLKYFS
jgi:hypothetical protein